MDADSRARVRESLSTLGLSLRGWRDIGADVRRLVGDCSRRIPARMYALGGPVALVRALVAIASRRRARYRGHPDDVMASSRFTIPVSVILPIDDEQDVSDAVDHLLALTYPEHEVIVVTSAPHGVPPPMRERYDLKACEIFFRRSLRTPPVRALYRSGADTRLLVVECDARDARRRLEQRRQPGAIPVRVLRRSSCPICTRLTPQEHGAGDRGPGPRHRSHDHDCG